MQLREAPLNAHGARREARSRPSAPTTTAVGMKRESGVGAENCTLSSHILSSSTWTSNQINRDRLTAENVQSLLWAHTPKVIDKRRKHTGQLRPIPRSGAKKEGAQGRGTEKGSRQFTGGKQTLLAALLGRFLSASLVHTGPRCTS